jgi:hypothetical protein
MVTGGLYTDLHYTLALHGFKYKQVMDYWKFLKFVKMDPAPCTTSHISTRTERPHVAVSKRLRFEILRRDNHTCYYCGRKPPEVEITIDHVLPQALGGADEASNLVAACRECNGGKTSIAPDSPLVARVDEDAIRWSAAIKAASEKASASHEAVSAYREEFRSAWAAHSQPAPLDENWRSSVENFRVRGLPIEVLTDAVHKSMGARHILLQAKFKYLCGIAWNEVKGIEKNARALFEAAGGTAADLRLAVPSDDQDEDDEWVDPTTEPVIETVVAVWLSTFQAAHGEDPPAAALRVVREEAEELYPEWFHASIIVDGAERAATQASPNLTEYCDDGDEAALLRAVARSFFRGWASGAASRGESSRPTSSQWADVALAACYASAAGYKTDNIAMAAYSAASRQSADLKMFTVEDAIEHMGAPNDRDREAVTRSQEWIDATAGLAELHVKQSNRNA